MTPTAPSSASDLHGVNWADPRDNFVCGPLLPSGIVATDTYPSAFATATAVAVQLRAATGANTVRLPVNVDTVTGSWWGTYRAVIDAVRARGMSVILSEWDSCSSKDGRFDPGWESLWDKVVAAYGGDRGVLFEPMNEPYGYSDAAWLDAAAQWLSRYPTVPRGRIVISGAGYNMNVLAAGRDRRFAGTLLSVHAYTWFWPGTHTLDEWRAYVRDRVGEFRDRVVFSEWGTSLTGGLDFGNARSTDQGALYLRGLTDAFRELGIGSVYWPGLRQGDSFSLTQIAPGASGATTRLEVANESAVTRLRHGWRFGS